MTALSWSIIIFSTLCCQGTGASWMSCAEQDQKDSVLDKIWNYVSSLITWFDSGGYDLFDICPEEEEPDWDLFEPEGKRCRKLSELLYPDNVYWKNLLSNMRSYLPDLSVFTSALDSMGGLAIWRTLYDFVVSILTVLQLYLSQLVDVWNTSNLYLSSLEISKRIPVFFFNDNIQSCFRLYLSKFVLYNDASLSLIVAAACLTAIFVVCQLFTEDDTSCTLKRVTFSNIENRPESANRRPQRLARIRPSRSTKKDKQRKKRQRQRPASRDSSTDPDTYSQNGAVSSQDHSAMFCLQTTGTGSDELDCSHIDDEALRYIVGGATDSAPQDVKERIRNALQVIVSLEEEECCRPMKEGARNGESRDSTGSVVYDIRYKDQLPKDVMDVLFCIDPKCDHDHSRYEMRGCKILVKPIDHKQTSKIKSRPKEGTTNAKVITNECQSGRDKSDRNAYATIEVSPTEVHVWGQDEDFVHKYHKTLTGQDCLHGAVTGSSASSDEIANGEKDNALSKQIRGPDALDQDVQRADSFPDWRAPGFDQDCPYCKMPALNGKGPKPNKSTSRSNGEHDASSSDLSPYSSGEEDSVYKSGGSTSGSASRDTSPDARCTGVSGPHPRRTDKELMELLGEAVLEDTIGPPQANSSFQRGVDEEDLRKSPKPNNKRGTERDLEYSSQKILHRRANKNRVHTAQINDEATVAGSSFENGQVGGQGPVMYGSLRIIQPPTRDPTRNGDAFQRYTYSGPNAACRLNPVLVRTIEPLDATTRHVPVRGDGESSGANYSVNQPAGPAVYEDGSREFSLSQELEDASLNDSQISADLVDLNKSLSFYGDVSMVELAASWVVKNVIERATKYMSAMTGSRLKESLLDISTGIIEAIDLLE